MDAVWKTYGFRMVLSIKFQIIHNLLVLYVYFSCAGAITFALFYVLPNPVSSNACKERRTE